MLERMEKRRDVDGYEVRIFCIPDAISHLTPLVIGSNDVFLGLEDTRYYCVQEALHIRDKESRILVTKYFDALWNDKRVYELRSAMQIEDSGIQKARSKIRALKNKRNSEQAHCE